MSTQTDSAADDESGTPSREPAVRVLANELNYSTYRHKEADDDRAPNYLLLGSGVNANRVIASGTVTDIERDEDKNGNPYARAFIADPSGHGDDDTTRASFTVYAGQYQPEVRETLVKLDEQEDDYFCVTVVGKPRVYVPDDDPDTKYVSITPESLTRVPEADRNAWVAETVEATLDRVEAMENGEAPQGDLAREMYGENATNPAKNGAVYAAAGLAGEDVEDLDWESVSEMPHEPFPEADAEQFDVSAEENKAPSAGSQSDTASDDAGETEVVDHSESDDDSDGDEIGSVGEDLA